MIDPNKVTNFDRTDDELLEFWLFCLFVRGKNADIQAVKLDDFVDICRRTANKRTSLMAGLLRYKQGDIDGMLRSVKAGQYDTLSAAIYQTVLKLEEDPEFLRRASARDLEAIHGVGPKTARYFILHTRPKARVAALDTHILRYLRDRTDEAVPRTTPTGKRYAELEKTFLLMADFEGVDPADMDLAIWQASRETHHMDWRRYLGECHGKG